MESLLIKSINNNDKYLVPLLLEVQPAAGSINATHLANANIKTIRTLLATGALADLGGVSIVKFLLNDSCYDLFERAFKPADATPTMMSRAMRQSCGRSASLIWKNLTDKQRESMLPKFGLAENAGWQAKWLLSNGITPVLTARHHVYWRGNFERISTYSDGGRCNLTTFVHQTKEFCRGFAERHIVVADIGLSLSMTNIGKAFAMHTAEGLLLIMSGGDFVEDYSGPITPLNCVDPPVSRHLHDCKLIKNKILPNTAEEVRYLYEKTGKYHPHVIDQENLYQELLTAENCTIMALIATHCNNLRALIYVLDNQPGVDTMFAITNVVYNGCVKYLLELRYTKYQHIELADIIRANIARNAYCANEIICWHLAHVVCDEVKELVGAIPLMDNIRRGYIGIRDYAALLNCSIRDAPDDLVNLMTTWNGCPSLMHIGEIGQMKYRQLISTGFTIVCDGEGPQHDGALWVEADEATKQRITEITSASKQRIPKSAKR